ncbi:MAG: hypothetical protein ABJA62_03720 [Luteimonas sp.]
MKMIARAFGGPAFFAFGMLCAACVFAAPAWAAASAKPATYFVRTDGGDAHQCTGRADAAYPGRGSAKACAWKHPFFALPPGGKPRIAGGDTLMIGAGDYMLGYGAAGAAQGGDACDGNWRWDCHMPPVPSGPSADMKTRILGSGYATGCRAAPTLWGTERADEVIDLQGSSNVEIACLEITDHSDCIEQHVDPAVRCERDKTPYGAWAVSGIVASASHDVVLRDLDIHGLAHSGIHAGGLRDWTLERVKINGNGWAGWDGDIGDGSANAGDIVMRDIEIAWNGCAERWKTRELHGCWAQEGGGYGDGLGTAKTGGRWLIERARVHHNTSDGIDLLYLDGGADSSATLRQVYAAANAGNQIKTRGAMLVENSVVVGQCAYFKGHDSVRDGDLCRAEGNALSIELTAGRVATIRHNTIAGEGDCLILTEAGTATSRVEIQDNALIGYPDFRAGDGELTCGHYAERSAARVSFSGNAFWNVKDGQCPSGNLCDRDPKLKNMRLAAFDPTPLPDSPLIDRASGKPSSASDFYSHPRSIGRNADIGAVERQRH